MRNFYSDLCMKICLKCQLTMVTIIIDWTPLVFSNVRNIHKLPLPSGLVSYAFPLEIKAIGSNNSRPTTMANSVIYENYFSQIYLCFDCS